jgi:hypothetical protein
MLDIRRLENGLERLGVQVKGDDLPLQTLGARSDGAVLVDQTQCPIAKRAGLIRALEACADLFKSAECTL